MNGRLLTVAYDGTNYSGFQYQANGLAVQQVIEEVLARLEKKPVRIKGASRTDAGVHAQGQRVFYVSQNALPKAAYIKGANALLPPDIAIVDMREVSEHFNPRRTAGKIYRYTLHCAHMRDPLRVRSEWTLYRQLNVPAMQQAATHLVGTHDFSAFQAADCDSVSQKHGSHYGRNTRRCRHGTLFSRRCFDYTSQPRPHESWDDGSCGGVVFNERFLPR